MKLTKAQIVLFISLGTVLAIVTGIYIGSYFWIERLAAHVPSEIATKAGQIGDRFGAVNALFSGCALLLIGWSLIQTNKSIRLQSKEMEEQTESWVFISYLNVLDLLRQSSNSADSVLAALQLSLVYRDLRDRAKDHISGIAIDFDDPRKRSQAEAVAILNGLIAALDGARRSSDNSIGWASILSEIEKAKSNSALTQGDFLRILKAVQETARITQGLVRESDHGNLRATADRRRSELISEIIT